jgi:hypothetical protein
MPQSITLAVSTLVMNSLPGCSGNQHNPSGTGRGVALHSAPPRVMLPYQPPVLGGGTNHGTLTPWQLTFLPLMLAISHPSCLTVPSMVAVRFWPPTSVAVIWKVLACMLTLPEARAIAFMSSQEIIPDSPPFEPTTTCQSREGQPLCALEWNV